jgi:hypothetical protein
MADECGCLGASFFFSRNKASTSNPFLVFTTIAYQLATFNRKYRRHLDKSLKKYPDIVTSNLEEQLEKLILEPIHAVAGAFNSPQVVLVVDAVGECGAFRERILSLLCTIGPKVPIRLKLFLSMRPESDFRSILISRLHDVSTQSFILHNVEEFIIRADIEHFLRHHFSKIANEHPCFHSDHIWPGADVIQTLTNNSDKLFISAATIIRFLDDHRHDPMAQLCIVMDAHSSASSVDNPYHDLDVLYGQVIASAVSHLSEGRPMDYFQQVIRAVVLLFDILSAESLAHLLQLVHPSFCDFMALRNQGGEYSLANFTPQHEQLALACFAAMNHGLRKDICGIKNPCLFNADVDDLASCIHTCIPPELQYACKHWASHLVQCDSESSALLGALMVFSSQHLLHWLEVLSLLGCLQEATNILQSAQDWIHVSHSILYV